jgi:hypothetical protein
LNLEVVSRNLTDKLILVKGIGKSGIGRTSGRRMVLKKTKPGTFGRICAWGSKRRWTDMG